MFVKWIIHKRATRTKSDKYYIISTNIELLDTTNLSINISIKYQAKIFEIFTGFLWQNMHGLEKSKLVNELTNACFEYLQFLTRQFFVD